MTTTNQNTEVQYINFHAEGICYVNRFRTNEAQNGDTYCSVTLGFLHGAVGGPKQKKPRVTYIDCNVRNDEICDILQQHEAAILGDSKVTAVMRISDIFEGEPFEATIKNKDGSTKKKMVSSIKARLIGMKQLKVNGEVVYSKSDDSDSEEQPTEEQNDAPVIQDEVAESAEAPVEHEALAPEVQLDPKAPDFAAQRDHLKELGYVWDRDLKLWVLRQAA
ncbi:MAG: DUF3577 domain-containing protein [Methyloprofundus sp.]|nr:DUF3577 domain-containing protein [Methyloprofundus sp.]